MPSTITSRIDGLTTSVAVKPPIKIMATAALTLSGEQTINSTYPDGSVVTETVLDGDRVGVNGQADKKLNGIYVCRTTAWERAKDFDGSLDAVYGTLVTDSVPVIWRLITPIPVLFGTSNIEFETEEGFNQGNAADLANDTDREKGAADVGRAVETFQSVVGLIGGIGVSTKVYTLKGYHSGSNIGGGEFYWDANRAKSLHNGGTIISPTVPWDGTFATLSAFLNGTGETDAAGTGCWVRRYEHDIHVTWFGAVPNDATKDNKDAMEAAKQAVIATSAPRMPGYILPDGELYYSLSPNFGEVGGFRVIGPGADGCRLKYTGSAHALDFDPSAFDINFRYGYEVSGFLVDAGANGVAGVYLENIAHSHFKNVFSINGASNCILFDLRLAVLVNFDTCGVTVNRWAVSSTHQESWRLSTSPSKGGSTTACTFTNCIGEGASLAGWRLISADVCTWDGGTGETNTGRGVLIASTSRSNTFNNFAMEANTTADALDEGQLTQWSGGYSISSGGFVLGSTAKNTKVNGLFTNSISVTAGAVGASFENVDYNHLGTGTFTDSGADTLVINLRDRTSGLYVYPKKARVSITVGASPFTYTNATGRYQQVVISGGTVTQILYKRGADTVLTGQIAGMMVVAPGDELVVSHSGAPSMSRVPFGNMAI